MSEIILQTVIILSIVGILIILGRKIPAAFDLSDKEKVFQKHCTKCGEELTSNDIFCRGCGASIKKLEDGKNFTKKNSTAKIVGFLLLALFIVGILATTMSPSPAPIEKPEPSQKPLTTLPNPVDKTEKKTNEEKTNQNKIDDLVSIIKYWKPLIAYIECNFHYGNVDYVYLTQSGSGMIFQIFGGYYIFTNKHILLDEGKFAASSCDIKFPEHDKIFTAFLDDFGVAKSGIDQATIEIKYPDNYIKNIITNNFLPDQAFVCNKKASVGDPVVILGYPAIGSQLDITATEGIISGYDGNYYITSAKIEQGNSGGAAISVKNNCYLGMPTFVKIGEVESLGRILRWETLFEIKLN